MAPRRLGETGLLYQVMMDPVIADLNRYLRELDRQDALDEWAEVYGPCECGAGLSAEGHDGYIVLHCECGYEHWINVEPDYGE